MVKVFELVERNEKISDVNFTHKMMIHCHFYWKWKVAFHLFTRLCIKFVIDFVQGCIMNKSTKNRFHVWNHQQKCCWKFFEGLYFSETFEMTLVNVENHFGGARTVIFFLFCGKITVYKTQPCLIKNHWKGDSCCRKVVEIPFWFPS